MDWQLYIKIIDELGAIGKRENFQPGLTYCYMGEPFLADNLADYVAAAQERGIDVYLNSNASAMTQKKIDALLQTGFDGKIHVSFHGVTPEVYQRITGLDYQNSLDHTMYLIKNYRPEKICIRGVDDNWPEGEAQRWHDFWRPYATELEYLPPISRCGSVKRLSRKKKDKVRLYGCEFHHPLVEMVILYDGRAVMCCQDMGRELIWGNVAEQGLEKVWNGPIRRHAVKKLYSGKAAGMNFLCSRCEQALDGPALVKSVSQAAWRKIKKRAAVL